MYRGNTGPISAVNKVTVSALFIMTLCNFVDGKLVDPRPDLAGTMEPLPNGGDLEYAVNLYGVDAHCRRTDVNHFHNLITVVSKGHIAGGAGSNVIVADQNAAHTSNGRRIYPAEHVGVPPGQYGQGLTVGTDLQRNVPLSVYRTDQTIKFHVWNHDGSPYYLHDIMIPMSHNSQNEFNRQDVYARVILTKRMLTGMAANDCVDDYSGTRAVLRCHKPWVFFLKAEHVQKHLHDRDGYTMAGRIGSLLIKDTTWYQDSRSLFQDTEYDQREDRVCNKPDSLEARLEYFLEQFERAWGLSPWKATEESQQGNKTMMIQ